MCITGRVSQERGKACHSSHLSYLVVEVVVRFGELQEVLGEANNYGCFERSAAFERGVG